MTIKAKLEKIFLVLFGTAFIIYGLMIPVLSIVGTKTTGNITTVRKINIERGGTIPNRYAYAVRLVMNEKENHVVNLIREVNCVIIC